MTTVSAGHIWEENEAFWLQRLFIFSSAAPHERKTDGALRHWFCFARIAQGSDKNHL